VADSAPIYRAPGWRPRTRPSAARRGYGWKWSKARTDFLALSCNRFCRYCKAEGRETPATCVDHIEPVNGASDPNFWKRSNWAPCCRSHNTKRAWQHGRYAR